MSETQFQTKTCNHCGYDIESPQNQHRLGENTVHTHCLNEFVDRTPKLELTPYTCETCLKSYWTKGGLEIHRNRKHEEGEE